MLGLKLFSKFGLPHKAVFLSENSTGHFIHQDIKPLFMKGKHSDSARRRDEALMLIEL